MKAVSDEIRTALMEAAAWDRVGVSPSFLTEDDDGEEEAPAEEAAPAEEEATEEEEAEEEVVEEATNTELLHALLSEMSDEEMLEHVNSILDVIQQASEVIEEEEAEAEAVA